MSKLDEIEAQLKKETGTWVEEAHCDHLNEIYYLLAVARAAEKMAEALKTADRYNARHSAFSACAEVDYFNSVQYAIEDYKSAVGERTNRNDHIKKA